jgi:non-ribosomal peptide synthetase component F
LIQIKEEAIDILENQDMPFDHIVQSVLDERVSSINPLVQVMFTLQNTDNQLPEIDGLSFESILLNRGASDMDISFQLSEEEQGLVGKIEYNSVLFESETLIQLWQHLEQLIRSVVADPEIMIGSLLSVSGDTHAKLTALWQQLSVGKKNVLHWQTQATELPQWEKFCELAYEQGIEFDAYMAVTEYE